MQNCSLAVLYHINDISTYLKKFDIINGIAILDRTFADVKILKPILAAISLLGIHITRPFHALMMDPETNYSILLQSFSKLYSDLTSVSPLAYLTTNKVSTFIGDGTFNKSLPERILLDEVEKTIVDYKSEIIKIMKLALELFANGFSHQKGSIFGIGPQADCDTGQY